MMPLLISGPIQPGNNIDVYFSTLIEDLNKLWRDGVHVFDGNTKEYFLLRAMIFCTINDFPAYGNLSGFKTKGKKTCPICLDDTCAIRLKHGAKDVYLGHRRYLREDHEYRTQPMKFDGTNEDRQAPEPRKGYQIYESVKK